MQIKLYCNHPSQLPPDILLNQAPANSSSQVKFLQNSYVLIFLMRYLQRYLGAPFSPDVETFKERAYILQTLLWPCRN